MPDTCVTCGYHVPFPGGDQGGYVGKCMLKQVTKEHTCDFFYEGDPLGDRLEDIGNKLDTVDTVLDVVDTKFDTAETRLDDIEDRLDDLEGGD